MGNIYGARGGTRTPTVFLPSGPKPGASTNFATRAGYQNNNGRSTFANHPFEIGQP